MDNKYIGKTKIVDIITCSHKGYTYDMPVARINRADYMTTTKKTFVFNLADKD